MLRDITRRIFGSEIADLASHLGRIAINPGRQIARLRAAHKLLAACPPAVHIDPETGYWLGNIDDIPGLTPLFGTLNNFAESRMKQIDSEAIRADAAARKIGIKPFYFNILRRSDLPDLPEISEFATSDAVLSILANYYGLLPELSHVAIFLSGFLDTPPRFGEPGWQPRGTQCWHWDNGDLRHVKLFVLLDDVGEDDGPLCFLPRHVSRRIQNGTGRRFTTSPIKRDDEMAAWYRGEEVVKLVGKAGTAALLDTTRCIHQGSRCPAGRRRTVFSLHYVRHAEYARGVNQDYQDINMATFPEIRAGVARNPLKSLAWRLVQPVG